MPYTQSLRVIGQLLEAAGLAAFELRTEGENLLVETEALTQKAEWILRRGLHDRSIEEANQASITRTLRFTPADISLLDTQARRQRGPGSTPGRQAFNNLSQLLRTLGEHLDRTKTNSFRALWKYAAIWVDSASARREPETRTFSPEKLEQIGYSLRFRRSTRQN